MSVKGLMKGMTLAALNRFREARSGQVMMLFALALIPIMFGAGAAIDYGRRSSTKAQLDSALDASVLAIISRKSNSIDTAAVNAMETQFRAEAAKLPGVTVTSFTGSPVNGANNLALSASYEATVSTTLSNLMKSGAMKVTGSASSQRNIFQYIDFYLLLDNSPSMGLPATQADIDKMVLKTANQKASNPERKKCAFACHEFKSNTGVTTEDTTDNYYLAKREGIKLRIDNLREATQQLVDSAKAAMRLPDQYRMAIYSFSDINTKLSALTKNLDTTKTEASKIDLAYSWSDQRDNQTSYIRALPFMNTEMPASGNGLTASAPIRFLFFVTDGVQDAPIDGKTMTSYDKKVGGDRFIGAIDPALCKPLKDRGIRIGVIYTTYLPLDAGAYYNQYYVDNVKRVKDVAPANLRSCASEGLYFPVETGGDINVAMQALFQAAVSSVRLTN